MGGKQNRKHRGLKGNVLLVVTAVVLCGAVVAAAILLYRKIPAQTAGATVSGQSSSGQPQSQAPSSSQPGPSSSSPASVSSSPPASSSAPQTSSTSGTSSSPVKLAAFSADTFKNALFIGDSFAEGVGVYYSVSVKNVIGKTSMTSYSALKRSYTIGGKTQTVTAAAAASGARAIYIELGSNDVTMGRSTEKFSAYYGQLIDGLKSSCRGAKIYVQSVFPVSTAYESKSTVTNAKIDAYNTALSALCAQKGVTYLDVASALKGADGALQSSLTTDGLHMKKSGYKLWLSYLSGSAS